MHTEYKFNKRFRDYVDKYCKTWKISLEEALTHELVRQAYLYYREVRCMGKAIIVLDMPKNCYECKLQVRSVVGERLCVINNRNADYCASKAYGCPLKEIEKKEWAHTENPMRAYSSGWNACLDEILNGGNENV